MSKRAKLSALAIVALLCLVVAVPAGAGEARGKVCIVYEPGGSDSNFNQSAAEGVRRASSKFKVDAAALDADTQADVVANLDAFVTAGDCDLILGVGFLVGMEMEPFIAANPGQRFAILDFTFGPSYPNAAEVVFSVNEAAFLAGYAAAGLSETGKVGVFGGLPIPPVTYFMDGYALGVEHYNAMHGTSVEVLGWDPDTQSGLFTFTFVDRAAGQAVASDLYDQGSDTVFAVAGLTGFGALDEAELRKAAGEPVRVVGVDFDWYGTFGDPNRVILTSVIKDLGVAAYLQIEALVNGTWQAGWVVEGLESGAVDIAKFHKLNRDVSGSIKKDLKVIREGIIDGSLPTLP